MGEATEAGAKLKILLSSMDWQFLMRHLIARLRTTV
jgi:hypothetical protein